MISGVSNYDPTFADFRFTRLRERELNRESLKIVRLDRKRRTIGKSQILNKQTN